jgi:[ribosomal protein S5]-alanine N-acetyltransferase
MLDLGCVQAASVDPRISRGTTVPRVWTAEAGRAFIARQHRRLTDGEGMSVAIVRVDTREAVGLVYLGRQPEAGVLSLGYWVIPEVRRRGFGVRAVRLAVGWALALPGIDRVVAWVEPDNPPSAALLLAAGFAADGLLPGFLELDGERVDVLAFTAGKTAPRAADLVDGPR